MTTAIHELFNTRLPAAMQKYGDESAEIGATFQFNVLGDGGGAWFVDASPAGPDVSEGDPGRAECILTITAEDFEVLYDDPRNNALPLYFEQRLRVDGNVMLGMRLHRLFELVMRG
jgi:hypothetical protein